MADSAHSSNEDLGSLPPGGPDSTRVEGVPSENKDSPAPPTSPAKPKPNSVKKIINSGAFGPGAVKSTAAAASPFKKSTSAPLPAKSSMPPKVTTAAVAPPPSRRASLAPASKASTAAAAKTPFSASTTTKPSSRLSVALSPDPTSSLKSSTTRPRASVAEGVKRTNSISRTSAARPPSVTAVSLPRTPGAGSISSIREVKADEQVVELQRKLDEATASLSSRDVTLAALETRVTEATTALGTALAELESKIFDLDQLQQEKADTEKTLKEAHASLQTLQAEQENNNTASLLHGAQTELQAAKATIESDEEAAKLLRSQIETLESQIKIATEELQTLRHSSESAARDAIAAAAVEHAALVQAQRDLDVVREEKEASNISHSQAFEEATSQIQALENRVSDLVNLESELSSLRAEKEASANRITELEIEVYEAKESVERAEDDRDRAITLAKSLKEELAKAAADSELALKAKDDEFSSQAVSIKNQHSEEVAALKADQESLSSQLVGLESKVTDTQASLEEAQAEHLAYVKEHAAVIQSLEDSHEGKLAALNAELQRVQIELQDQEKTYNSKVEVVKEEHEQRLQEAFQRANDTHGVELHSLRAESQTTLEQVRAAYEESIQALKAEHATALNDQANTLEKQISSQNIELKATQDDLAKAKAALSSSLQEFQLIKSQWEEARKNAETMVSSVSADRADELAQLTKELLNAREDHAALQAVLLAQKDLFSEMLENHAKELEEAAKGRAEEAMKYRAAHEAETAALLKETSEYATKLSDIEGELVTLKATIAAEPVSAPKSNGNAQTSTTGVTKEEIQRMHEAHNLKLNDTQAEFEKTLKALKEDLEAAQARTSELELEVDRKNMEISYLEQDHEENQDQLTRLREDVIQLHEKLEAKQ